MTNPQMSARRNFALYYRLAVMALAFAAFQGQPPEAVAQTSTLSDGLVSHWHLDEASGLPRADSKGTNNLTDKNVGSVPGKMGQAAKFVRVSATSPDNSYLSVPHNPSLVFGNSGLTVAVWVYLTTNVDDVGIIGKYNAPEWGVLHHPGGGAGTALRFTVRAKGDNQLYTVYAPQLSAQAWHFVVAWHDPAFNTINLQVNGGTVRSTPFPAGGLRTDLTDPLELGRNNVYSYFGLNGWLDEASLWKRALTESERTDLYNLGAGRELIGPPPPSPGSGLWQQGATGIFYNGNVGIGPGMTDPQRALDVVGGIHATGAITGGTVSATYQDVAEWVPSVQKLQAGTVVTLDPGRSNHVLASTAAYDTGVAGVVSAQPGVILGQGGGGKVMVATTGRVRVRVDATRGAIRVGDLLVTSDAEGVAMKSVPVEAGGARLHRPGTILGKALEPLEKGKGEIMVLLSLQ